MSIEIEENPYHFPVKAAYTKFYVYFKGTVLCAGSESYVCEKLGFSNISGVSKEYTVESDFMETAYKFDLENYRRGEIERETKFIKELYKKHGFVNNELNDMIYSKAYEDGHAYGWSEVESHFSNLAEFVQDILDKVGCLNDKVKKC